MLNGKLYLLLILTLFLNIQNIFAEQKQINLLDKNGVIVEQVNFDTVNGNGGKLANERMKLFWYCWSKNFFNGLSCDYSENNVVKNIGNNTFSQQALAQSVPVNTPSGTLNSGTQIVYQIIERAVPGPQGPAGKDGLNGRDGLSTPVVGSQFLSQYTPGGEYNGFGIVSNSAVNPTGDASLSTISGSGLISCNATTSKLVYNSTSKMFECATDQGGSGLTGLPVNATFTLATISSATVTNLFSTNFLTSGFSIIPSIYGTNATFTAATTTYIYSQNATLTNLNSTFATFSYATVTNGFFTNLSVTGAVQAALTNGYIFRGGTNNYSEATSTLFVSNSSNVGVGTTTPGAKFSVQGNVLISGSLLSPNATSIAATTGTNERMLCVDRTTGQIRIDTLGNCYNFMSGTFSDINLKKDIATITGALEKVKQLNTVNFKWIDESRGTSTQLGYIAQDVERVAPEVVIKDENGFLKVNYMSLSAIYANAIKELDVLVFTRINDILNRLTKNEEDILNLKNRVQNLETTLNIQNISSQVPETTPEPVSEPEEKNQTVVMPTEPVEQP